MNSISLPRTICALLCLLIGIPTYAQSQQSACQGKGSLIINEVGNLAEAKSGEDGGEFIELIVTGEDPTIPVNLEGFIIDDNYNTSITNGATPGHVKLGGCFSAVMPGTIILLYDDKRSFPGIDVSQDGAPNSAGVYQIPFGSDCLIKNAKCPGYSDGNYSCTDDTGGETGDPTAGTGTSGTASPDWRQYLHLNDPRDVVQVRNNKKELVHAVMWWPVKSNEGETGGDNKPDAKNLIFPDQNSSFAVKVHDGDLAGRSIQFTEGDYKLSASYNILDDSYSPGVANSPENQAFIDALKPLVCPGEAVDVGCFDNSNYCYVWDDDPSIVPQGGGVATVYPVGDTHFTRTTLDGDGNLLESTVFFVRTHPGFSATVIEEQLTAADCPAEATFRLTATVDDDFNYTYKWSNDATTPSIEVAGDQTYTVTITGEHGCTVVESIEPAGNPAQLGAVVINASTPMLCGSDPVQLTTSFVNYSNNGHRTYAWSNGSTTALTQVTVPGEYRVTVTTSAGCTFTDAITIEPGFSMEITASADQACTDSPVVLTPSLSGQVPQGLYYEWSTEDNTSQLYVTEGGTYSLDLISADGCVLTSSITIADGVALELEASADRLIPGAQVSILPVVTGGTEPFTYTWSSGASSDQLAVNVAGDYVLTVTDGVGCSAIDTVTILPFEEDLCEGTDANIVFHEPDCEYYGSARLEVLLSSGVQASSYEWSTGESSADLLIDNGETTYSVTVTTTNGCRITSSIQAPAFETLRPSFSSTKYCDLVDFMNIVPLGENQAIVVLENYSLAQFEDLMQGAGGVSLDVTATYTGEDGEVFTTLPLVTPGTSPDPTTWAGDLTGIKAGTEVTLGMEIRIFNLCPIICTDTKTILYEAVEDEDETVIEENPEIILTDYDCGDTYVPDSADVNTQPLQILSLGELVTVNGFPILIQSLDGNNPGQGAASSDGYYSGTGLVPTPWNNRTLSVSFAGKVNSDRVIYQGEVNGIQDNLTNYDFSTDSLIIGGDICIPPEDESGYDENGIDPVTGLDQWGFVDSTGLHSVTGEPYDEYGYDRNGNHVENGSPYGPDGCSRERRDADGNYCEPTPYVNPDAQAFLDSIGTNLGGILTDALNQAISSVSAELAAQEQQCNNLRAIVDALISDQEGMLGFDRKAIFGDSNQYYNPGLSLRFSEEPESLGLNVENRDARVKQLEDNHVALYHCDVTELEIAARKAELLEVDLEGLQDYITRALGFLSSDTLATFSDPVNFQNWLIRKINEYAQSQGSDGSVFFAHPPGSPGRNGVFEAGYQPPTHHFRQLATVAGNNISDLGFASQEEMILYELNSQFQQGHRMIQGVHRAHFLDKLHRLQTTTDSSGSSSLLPLAVTRQIGGIDYTILLDDISFSPGGSPIMNAYMIIEDPESGQKLVFQALETNFGVGGAEQSILNLASTVAIRINNATRLILDANETNVSWDCEGFVGMAVGGKVELCRDFITPLDTTTLEPLHDSIRFALDFNVYATEWLDAVVHVNAGAFALTKYENLKWQLNDVVVDLSDRETPQFVPTEGYTSVHYTDNHLSPLWRGVYMSELSVSLPRDLVSSTGDTTASSVTIGVEDALFDSHGFTGEAFVQGVNLLGLNDGSAGGWPFSVDRFQVKVVHNGLAGAGFGGQIQVPIFSDTLRYLAEIYSQNRFKFTVQPDSTLNMNMLLAKATLLPSTKIEIGYDYSGFHAVATLTGNLKFEVPDSSSIDLTLPELYFKEFRVSNRDPYFDAGIWEIRNLGVNLSFGGFAMDLSRIKPYRGEATTEFGLGFDLAIDVGKNLSAGGRFGILGELEEINNRQRWKFKEIDLKGLFIDANISDGIHVYGALQWFREHPTYGKGFQGLLELDVDKGPLVFAVDAAAMFGNINDNKYFFVDAKATLPTGTQPTPLQINGFGGGVSYHMSNSFAVNTANFSDTTSQLTLPPLGQSISGLTYAVDTTIGLALKATVSVVSPKKELFNGWAGLEFVFNAPDHGGGLREIAIKGQGQFMEVPLPEPPAELTGLGNVASDTLPVSQKPKMNGRAVPLSAWVDLSYNFNDKVFDGRLEAYLNVNGFVTGAGRNHALVQAAVYVDTEKWYFNIGTPTAPAGVKVNMPLFNAGATAYFNMGTDIPDFPGLPANVASLAGLVNTNEGLRKSGGGIMFGANLWAEARLNAGPIQAYLNADIGFDLMLRDYGNAICEGSDQRIGINGWYAAGQSWVYLEGGVKLLGVPIFEAGLVGVMQARLPNPFWARATMAARVKLLFVEKKIRFDVEIGEQCTLVDENGQQQSATPIVNFIEPLNKAQAVATDAKPEIFFNYPIDRNFTGSDGSVYRAKIADVSLMALGGGYQLGFTEEWLNDRTTLKLIPYDVFPSSDSVRLDLTVEVLKGSTVERTETKSVVFHTDGGFDNIPVTNVAYSYPVDGMYDFYPQEMSQQLGFVQLNSGQSDLLTGLEPGTTNLVVLRREGQPEELISFDYNITERKITFPLPASQLTNDAVYSITLVQEDNAKQRTELLAPIRFRVSNFNQFNEKLAQMTAAPAAFGPSVGGIGFIAKKLEGEALIGDIARLGTGLEDPLVRFYADLNNTYVRNLERDITDGFPYSPSAVGCTTFSYSAATQFPQLSKAAGVSGGHSGTPLLIGDDAFAAGGITLNEGHTQYLRYEVPQEVYRRYELLETQISACVDLITAEFNGEPGTGGENLDNTIRGIIGDRAYQLLQLESFPAAPPGSYRIRAGYTLPDGRTTTPGWPIDIDYAPPSGNGFPFN